MKMRIEYAWFTMKGPVRANNEDNLRYPDECLPLHHEDAEMSGSVPAGPSAWFAVFDGMGGAVHGETASYLAAKELGEQIVLKANGLAISDAESCRMMNARILEHVMVNRTKGMGSTAAALCFDEDHIHGFNAGDSRCYVFSEGTLRQLSDDHAVFSPITGRGQLTQCLGIPESEFVLEPKEIEEQYRTGDLYLICSDGLSGALSDKRIAGILSGSGTLNEKLLRLREAVTKRGAEDNTTVILIAVRQIGQAS